MIDNIQLFDDSTDRAVSPVIGVILMVAITVILAAVIGTFVLGMADQTGQSGPNTQMSVSDSENNYDPTSGNLEDFVTMNHNGGDALEGDEIRIVVRYSANNSVIAEYDRGDNTTSTGAKSDWLINGNQLDGDSTIETGDVVKFQAQNDSNNNPGDDLDYVVQVIHVESEKQLVSSTVEVK